MSFQDDNRGYPTVLRARANGRSYVPPFATTASSASARLKKTNDPLDIFKENVPTIMANNGHRRNPSGGSVPDLTPLSPSRIPQPASRASAPRSREPMSLAQALQHAADRHRVAQGSPSPAPRPSRQQSVSSAPSAHRPLVNMFPDKPIDLGRFGKRPPRDAKIGSKDSFGFSSHNDGDTDDEFDRKMKKFEADDKIFEALLKEEKNGPFAQRKLNPAIARPTFARGSATRSGNGNRDEPRRTWGDTGYARQHTEYYRRFQDAPDEAAEHYQFLTGTGQGINRKVYNQSSEMPAESVAAAPPVRSTTTAPSEIGYSWQVDDDFTAGDMQGSTSPPVSFGRTNTRLDELKQLEIDAERQYPVPNKRNFLLRTNTKLDEIARLEKEAILRYPISSKAEESVHPPVRDLATMQERSEGESGRTRKTWPPFSRLGETRERLASTSERQQKDDQDDLRPNDADQEKDELNGVGKDAIPNIPVTSGDSGTRNTIKDMHEQPQTKGDDPALLKQQPSPTKVDPQDLLQRLARASSKSPSPRAAQAKVASRPQEEANAEADPILEDIIVSGDKLLKAPKPTVEFTGISRSSSTNSISSKTSVMSGDPTARIAAEAKLFALDNSSERGSLRAPSPLSETGLEVEVKEETAEDMDDETPRPDKFIDPLAAPTPVVPGAFIQTPAPIKVAHDADEKIVALSSKFKSKSPENVVMQQRDPSTFPRANKSDHQREAGLQRYANDKRRTKSASRHNSPVKNSAKPPTVKDDLRQIYQRHNIDDSELDDLTDIIMANDNPEEIVKILSSEVPNLKDVTQVLPVDEQLKRMNGMSETLKTGLAGIRNAKRGIERLEVQVSGPGRSTNDPMRGRPAKPARIFNSDICGPESDLFTCIHLPIPQLYRTTPKFKFTIAGLSLLLLAFMELYLLVECLFYDHWGKQQFCYRGEPCRWDMDDPEYGYVIPVKLDEWITGGMIRPHAAHWLEEAQDGWADVEDWWTNTDIRQISHQAIRDPVKKEQYWRRIEKKGLFPEWKPAAWVMPQIEAWEREAQAREEAEARAAMGYDVEDRDDPANDSMDKDQPISGDEAVDRLW